MPESPARVRSIWQRVFRLHNLLSRLTLVSSRAVAVGLNTLADGLGERAERVTGLSWEEALPFYEVDSRRLNIGAAWVEVIDLWRDLRLPLSLPPEQRADLGLALRSISVAMSPSTMLPERST